MGFHGSPGVNVSSLEWSQKSECISFHIHRNEKRKIVNVLKYLTLLKPFQKLTWQQIHKRVFAVILFLPFQMVLLTNHK